MPLKCRRGLYRPAGCPCRINLHYAVKTAARVLPNHSVDFLRDVYLAISFFSTHNSREHPGGYQALGIQDLDRIPQVMCQGRADKGQGNQGRDGRHWYELASCG